MTQASPPPHQDIESAPRVITKPSLISRISRYPATFSLLGITSLVYIGQEISLWLLKEDIILYFGAKINEAIFAGELWRFITPIFIHVGIWHIFVNMYSLYAIGPAVEGFFGTPRMLVVYFLSGISSVVVSLGFSSNPSVGASGAIFGLLGALGTFLFLHRDSLGQGGKAYLRQIVIVAVLNLGLGLAPGIDNWGHLGGLIAGCAIAWFLGPRYKVARISNDEPPKLEDQQPWKEVWPRIFPIALVISIMAYLAFQSPFSS